MKADLHTDVIEKRDGVERFALVWQLQIKDKNTGKEAGMLQGYVELKNSEEAQEHYDRLKAVGLIQAFIGPEVVMVMKSDGHGKLLSRWLTGTEFKDITEEEQAINGQ